MKRVKEGFLIEWLGSKRRKPLVIRGARQVGKSTLVRQFAQSQNLSLLEINLERHQSLNPIFKTLNPELILQNLKSLPSVSGDWTAPNKLLFLDEIQATPDAIAALRYFHEERPDIPIIAAGSLLEFTLSDHDFSMPVGRIQYLHLSPMSFMEVLLALGEIPLWEALQKFTLKEPLTHVSHQRLNELFSLYALTGGMPEAVQTYLDTQDLKKVRRVQNDLCDNFKDDFSKYGIKQDLLRLHQVFDEAPKLVGKKIKFSTLLPEEQSRTTKRILNLLTHARILTKVNYSHSNGLPLSSEANLSVFKIIFLDVGLANALLQTPLQDLYKKETMLSSFRGSIAEQLVGQELITSELLDDQPYLFYWLRDKPLSNAEVDFVIAYHGRVYPVEVKSGKSGTLKSLHQFMLEKKSSLAMRLDLNLPNLSEVKLNYANHKATSYQLISLPLYSVSQIPRILGDVVKESNRYP